MRRRAALLAGLLVGVAVPQGQRERGVPDGVEAFVNGDYVRAADILKPIAEAWEKFPDGDDPASFFMAAMYENGLGVSRDPLRACVLYMRHAAGGSVAMQVGMALSKAMVETSLSNDQRQECLLRSNIGFDHGFQPATLVLEPGHSIAFDLSAKDAQVVATITHGGKEKRSEVDQLRPGQLHLPMAHTELRVGPSRSTSRHFIEFFIWQAMPRPTWTLRWGVSEVVGDQLVSVAVEDLMTITAARPPAVDVRQLARLRVTDEGEARVGNSSRT